MTSFGEPIMRMVKKSISVSDQQADCISRDAEITAIRAALIAGERSGLSHKTVEEIWEQAQQR